MNTSSTLEAPVDLGAVGRRGPLSGWVVDHLIGYAGPSPTQLGDALSDDAQTALYLCYESHFGDIAPSFNAEWDPVLIEFRGRLEHAVEHTLRRRVGKFEATVTSDNVAGCVRRLIACDDGPSLSRHMELAGTLDQMRQLVRHRSAYQLKEGDGHTFGIPRLRGDAKQRLVQIQAGEYGADEVDRVMHSELFAQTMVEFGLDNRPNAYLASLPSSALAVSNLVSMFGLNRRLRSALVGHLAVFEMTSVEPMRRYARALRQMGGTDRAARFYDVHVLADAEHEVLVAELAAAHLCNEPDEGHEVMFGAACVLEVERWFAEYLLHAWSSSASASMRVA